MMWSPTIQQVVMKISELPEPRRSVVMGLMKKEVHRLRHGPFTEEELDMQRRAEEMGTKAREYREQLALEVMKRESG